MKGSFAMGMHISHGTNQYGQIYRPYTGIAELGRDLAYVPPSRDWRTVRYLFDGKRKSDDELVSPATARKIAAILRKAADDPKISPDGAKDAREFATAAEYAARLGEPWTWSG